MNKSLFLKIKNFLHKHILIKRLLGTCIGVIIVFLVFLLIPIPTRHENFKTLSELKKYAETLDEFLEMDNDNLFNPVYDLYYQKKFSTSFVKKIQEKFYNLSALLTTRPIPTFSVEAFNQMLLDVSAERNSRNWQNIFVQKIKVTPGSKIVVFGTAVGAFHGLIRCFEHLKQLQILDENLRITKPSYYIVFLGNIVDRSPDSLEMLSLLLRLLKNNPQNVVYLHGRHETPQYWRKGTLGQELEKSVLFLPGYSFEQIEKNVENFFNTLPFGLFCTLNTTKESLGNYFKIFPLIENQRILSLLKATNYESFLSQNQQASLETLHLQSEPTMPTSAEKYHTLKAIITDIKYRNAYEAMDGLRLLPPSEGVITWTILSTSGENARKALNFFYDAFAVIEPDDRTKELLITLYNHDIRQKDPSFKAKSYFFFSSKPLQH